MERRLPLDLVQEQLALGVHELRLLRPRNSEALLDEEAFDHEEFLPYWAELWPSGLELARTVVERPLGGVRVLELGCGLAVPSLAAAAERALVLATDWSPDAIALARSNAARNRLELETAVVPWSGASTVVERSPWPLVLAADVLYESRNCDLLLELLPQLVDRGEVLLSDPGRPATASFLERAQAAWWIETIRESANPRVVVRSLRKRAT